MAEHHKDKPKSSNIDSYHMLVEIYKQILK